MRSRLTKIVAGIALLAAFALGGATLAAGGQGTQAKTPATGAKAAKVLQAKARATTAPEQASGVDTDDVQDEVGVADANDPADASDANDPAEESASESGPGDGNGGHADEPADPNADHRNAGQE
jgi:hypothetical protein